MRLSMLSRVHLMLGVIGLTAFLASGLYMDRSLHHLAGMADAPRALYRSGHIYMLFSALLHLSLGTYVTPRAPGMGRILQYLGSLLLVAALVLFISGFIGETPLGAIDRPMTRTGIELSFAGTLFHALSAAMFRGRATEAAGRPRARDSRHDT